VCVESPHSNDVTDPALVLGVHVRRCTSADTVLETSCVACGGYVSLCVFDIVEASGVIVDELFSGLDES